MRISAGGGAFLLIRRLGSDFSKRKQVPGGPLRGLYLDGLRHINLINMALFDFLAAVAEALITTWVGTEYANVAGVMRFLAVGYLVQQSTGPVSLIFRGIDRCSREFECLIVQLVLALAWIPAGAFAFGLTGAAAAIAAGNGTAAVFLFWRGNETFQVRFGEFAARTLKPTLLPLTLAAGAYALTRLWPCPQRTAAAMQIIILGLGYIGLLLPLGWRLVLTNGEKKHVLARQPIAPTGSNTKKLLILCLVAAFGSVGGGLLAYDFLDNRIRSPRNIQQALGHPPTWPLSKAPEEIPFNRLLAMAPDTQPAKAIRSLAIRLNREREQNKARVFLFTGVDPGTGCSGITLNCAQALSELTLKVLVVDGNRLHPQQGLTTGLFPWSVEWGPGPWPRTVTTPWCCRTIIRVPGPRP